MNLYARSDINLVAVSGAGHTHARQHVQDFGTGEEILDKNFIVNCPVCEPQLLADGWAKNPENIELTPDERRVADAEEKTGNAMVAQMARALAENAADAVRNIGASARRG